MKKRGRTYVSVTLVLSLLCAVYPIQTLAYDAGNTTQYTVVSVGGFHSAVIDSNSDLWMWGEREYEYSYGELGTGEVTGSKKPIKVLSNVASVSCGDSFTVALKTDGSLWAWGLNAKGQIGNGGAYDHKKKGLGGGQICQTTPAQIMDNVVAVSCGSNHAAAIKKDGTLWMWGSNEDGQIGSNFDETCNSPVQIMDNVSSVSCGEYSTAAVRADGTLWTWGYNLSGVLGNGSTEFSIFQPTQVLNGVSAVSCGVDHMAAIKNDGSLWTWGANDDGQLGNGGTGNIGTETGRVVDVWQTTPSKVMDDVIFVACGRSSFAMTSAIKTDGSLWMWGNNNSVSLSSDLVGEDSKILLPQKVAENAYAISSGLEHNVLLKRDGTLWVWGHANNLANVFGGASNEDYSLVPLKIVGVSGLVDGQNHLEYIYDTIDFGENVALPVDKLDTVTNSDTASDVVNGLTSTMTHEQKSSATGADLATLYAETAVSKAASKKVSGKEIIINKAAVADLEATAAQASAAVETALVNGGITTARLVSNTVTLTTDETGEIIIKIDPDILETQVDKIRVETSTYAITLKVDDLKEDLTEILTITAQDVGSGFAPGNQNKKTTVKVNLPKGKTTNPVTVSLPKDSGDTTYQAVVKTDGTATSSKYNPATTTMDGKVNTSGNYTVQTNQKDFTDIANKSAEMQKAIRYLASKGIINGTSATEFSPDGSINRAEIAALLVRALGKLDNGATNSFTDVKSSDWYYSAAGSSQKCGLINGYTDNTFRGTTAIAKDQILAVAARVLKNEMGYKEPSNPDSYLAKYSDTVTKWAQPEVALATKENLVVYRVDGTFKGESNMTRGDAAIIIYRLFQKIW